MLDICDLDRCREARAVRDRGPEEAGGEAARVGCEAAVGDERGRAIDADAPTKFRAVEKARLKARGASGLCLAGERIGIEEVASKIEAVPRHLPGVDAEGTRAVEKAAGGKEGAAPGADGVASSDPVGEECEGGVDLVLDERGARRRRAEGRAAPVDDEDAVAVTG